MNLVEPSHDALFLTKNNHKGHRGETFVFDLQVSRWAQMGKQCPAMPGNSGSFWPFTRCQYDTTKKNSMLRRKVYWKFLLIPHVLQLCENGTKKSSSRFLLPSTLHTKGAAFPVLPCPAEWFAMIRHRPVVSWNWEAERMFYLFLDVYDVCSLGVHANTQIYRIDMFDRWLPMEVWVYVCWYVPCQQG